MVTAEVTAATALTAVAAIIGELGDVGGGNNQIASAFIPNVTGLAAGASVTATLVRSDTAAIIGSATATNSGAGAAAVGPVYVETVVPAGFAGVIELQAVVSSGTGSAVGSATAPVVIKAIP